MNHRTSHFEIGVPSVPPCVEQTVHIVAGARQSEVTPQLQLYFLTGNKHGDQQPVSTVLVLVDRVSGGVSQQGCAGTHVSVCVGELGLVGTH